MLLVRSALFNFVFFGVTILLLPAGLLTCVIAPGRVHAFATMWTRVVLASLYGICGIRLEVTGREHLPRDGGLIASRHQSAFDTLIWMSLVPNCCYVLKQELLKIPGFGRLLRGAGMIAIDREGGASTIRGLVRDAQQAVEQGRQIIIFPEGTRSDSGAMLPLQPGIAALATRLRMPVVPVTTNSGRHWGRRAFRKYPGVIRIEVHPPLQAGLTRPALMRQLEQILDHEPS